MVHRWWIMETRTWGAKLGTEEVKSGLEQQHFIHPPIQSLVCLWSGHDVDEPHTLGKRGPNEG